MLRVTYEELFSPIANAIINGEEKLRVGKFEFKLNFSRGVLELSSNGKKLADIPCKDDFEVVDRRTQSIVYNIINLSVYGVKE